MRRLIFIDTETSCFAEEIGANTYVKPALNENNEVIYPHICQISWIVCSTNGEEVISKNYVIKPNGFAITESAASVHGITNEFANEHGVDIKDVIDDLIEDIGLYDCYKICGHNVTFDIHMIEAEALRLGYTGFFESLLTFHYADTCVNKEIMRYVGALNKLGRIKRPKLSELYFKLFGRLFENAHDSLADIRATKECYFECVKQNLLTQHIYD